MESINILSEDEVFKNGVEFDGDVCFSGLFGQQVYNRPMEEGGEPITGLVYEKYNNGHLAYYCYYENGFKNGEYVRFYKSLRIYKYCIMKNGQIRGKRTEWYENGDIKFIEYCKYGVVISYEKWDEKGNLIDKKIEPNDSQKKLLEKFELLNGSK